MQLCSEGAKVPFPAAGPGQSHAGGPGKFDFNFWKGNRPAYHNARRIFAEIWACEMITIRNCLGSWKIFVRETLYLTRESQITSR